MDFENLRKKMEGVAGEWNGDEPGLKEDRAHAANDILAAMKVIEEQLAFLREN